MNVGEITIAIPANGTWTSKVPSQKYFYAISTTGVYGVRVGNASENTIRKAADGFEEAKGFTKVTFYNRTAAIITTVVWIGEERRTSQETEVTVSTTVNSTTKDAQTYTKGSDVAQVNAGATLSFSGVDATKQRRQIVIANKDGANPLLIRDGNDLVFDEIAAGQKATYFTSGVVKVHNPAGAPVPCRIGETFYV